MYDSDNNFYPTRAYDLIEPSERESVDDYVKFIVAEQKRKNQRVDLALNLPIPPEFLKRSRNALLRPVVRAALAERILEESANDDISPDRVIKEYAKVAFSDMTDFVKDGNYGEITVKNINDLPADKVGAIKTIETKISGSGTSTKITLHDKLPALKTLTEMMGMTAPEQPPVLAAFVKQEIRNVQAKQVEAPEAEYVELLEHVEKAES